MATQAGYNLGDKVGVATLPAIKKSPVVGPQITPPAPPPPTGAGPNIVPPAPTGGGVPNIQPPAPTGETAVTANPGSTITSYANGGGPQILPTAPETAVVPGSGSTITSYAGGAGPQINPGVPNIQPPAPSGAGSPITSFGPGNDLVSAQVNPVASGRTGDTMSAVDAARNALAGGPNRSDLAAQYIDQWNQRTQPQFQHDLTDATKYAAANGRIGSGMLTNAYGDIVAQRDAARQVAQQGFATDALGGTIQDRLNNLGALSGLEGQQYGQDAANRNEVRGERGYQQGLSQQSFQNDAQRLALEEALTQGSYGRDSDRLNQLIQLGYMNNPGSLYLGASGQVQQGANQSQQGISDLLAQYFMGKNVAG